jgi:hypothetical protein
MPDLVGGEPLVFAVVPFGEPRLDDGNGAEAGELARPLGAAKRAREN